MESLESLRSRKAGLEAELERITIKRYGSTPWASGVQDQFKSESYSYNQYTNPERAYQLKNEIERLDGQIRTYAQRARAEREREEALIESRIPKYGYVSAGVSQTSHNPAIAARYNAQQRFFGMNKFQQTLLKITGQKRKFDRLWSKAGSASLKQQQEIADELNDMFKRR